MPWFALQSVRTEYELTSGNLFALSRHSLRVEVGGANWIRPHCFFDTGAPLSIISRTVAHGLGTALAPIPVRSGVVPAFENGKPIASVPSGSLLGWWDPIANALIPCALGELTVRFRDWRTGDVSDPLRLVAKVLQAPARPFNDRFVLLGTHFLTANGGQLHIEGQPWGLGGRGLFFPP